jgi:isocitrate dehydrogenase (NAD+)
LAILNFGFLILIHVLVFQTIAEGKTITGDLGGKASTKEYTGAIIQKLRA